VTSASKFSTTAGAISAAFDGPKEARALVVLAHGAGADMTSDYMAFFATHLADAGIGVCRFNFAYAEQGRKSPDRQPLLEATYREVADAVRERATGPLVLGGKSMGGRIASHIVADGYAADGLVFLGYPLHPPGKPERMRDAHLHEIEVPMLFVEGTRDPFCPLDTLESVTNGLPTEVVVVEDGDHSLKVRKSSGRSTPEAWQEAVDAIDAWVGRLAG
jgi:hypothetical protein